MGYFQVRYNSRGVNYDRRGFIRLATVKVSGKIVWKQWSKAHLKSYIKCSTWVSKAADIFFFIIWISCLHYLHKMTIKNSGSFRDYAQTMFSVIVRWCPVWPDWTIFKMYWEKILTTIAQIFGKFWAILKCSALKVKIAVTAFVQLM